MSKKIGEIVSMKTGQRPIIKHAVTVAIGCAMVAGFASNLTAQIPVTVEDVTDWSTTPVEAVSVNAPYLDFVGNNIFAGINTLSVTGSGYSFVANGFCIDPFHWSANGPTSGYNIVPLVDAPKFPAQLNAYTATEIEDLWAEYYSPTMSSPSAAALQIAIWDLVSSNAVASDGLSPSEAFSVTSYDYGAVSTDLASLATYSGPAANLIALSGPGQDYVIPASSVPDSGETFMMLALTLGALAVARPAILKSAGQLQKVRVIVPVDRPPSVQG
jgi:hypothetical protein